jgi:mycothiol synthase
MRTLNLPQELVIRAPQMDDIAAVAELFNAGSLQDTGIAAYTPDEVHRWWTIASDFDIATDAWLVEAPDGRAAGYTDIWCPPPHVRFYSTGTVHPALRERGIGRHLLRVLEARARELMDKAPEGARVELMVDAVSTNESAKRFFVREGFALTRLFWRMAIELDGDIEEPEWPAGVTVRTMVPGRDERAVWEATEEAFQDHYDHGAVPYEEWLKWRTSDPARYDPTLWFLAEAEGAIIGVAICDPRTDEDPDMGWIGNVGVRRSWRQHGVASALLRHAFRELRARGRRRAGLGVDAASLTGATRVYERAGMRVIRQFEQYARELRAGTNLVNQ